jgi:hypothetical protein
MLGWPMCGSMPDPSTGWKSNSLGDVPTNTARFILAVDRSQNNPDDLFEQAQSAEEAGDIAEAERLYRVQRMRRHPFNLGNLLRASARNAEAEAALRAVGRAGTLRSRH